jgi:hypothetical protein
MSMQNGRCSPAVLLDRLLTMHRLAAFFLLTVLLAALLPAAQGEGCRLCGKIGRCCCFLRPAATPRAHCTMQGHGSTCCMAQPVGRPAALRAAHFPSRTTGTFQTLFVTGALDHLAGLVAAARPHRPTRFQPPPPTPPPRSFRLV